MANLEEEWQELMDGVRKEIADRKDNGSLTGDEAYYLLDKLEQCMLSKKTSAWNRSGCTMDDDSDYYERIHNKELCPEHNEHKDVCGWSSSMGYHC